METGDHLLQTWGGYVMSVAWAFDIKHNSYFDLLISEMICRLKRLRKTPFIKRVSQGRTSIIKGELMEYLKEI
jgi:hypothetical protein